MLSVTSRDVIFARAFLILTCNLMSRASNTLTVCLSHVEFIEDALCIYLPKMKNDQLGQRPKYPRHIYANPIDPEVCLCFRWGCTCSATIWKKNKHSVFLVINNTSVSGRFSIVYYTGWKMSYTNLGSAGMILGPTPLEKARQRIALLGRLHTLLLHQST